MAVAAEPGNATPVEWAGVDGSLGPARGSPLGPWTRLPFARGSSDGWRANGLTTVALFGVGVLGVTVAILELELASGRPLLTAAFPSVSRSWQDAIWHMATAFAIALPARRRVLLWLTPVLALGLDGDHLFGAIFPTVTYRTAHSFVFAAAIGLVLYGVQGRTAAGVALGAVLEHVSVDGGAFPLFGPFATASYALPFAVSVAGLVGASVLLVLAARPAVALRSPRTVAGIAIAVAAVAIAFWLLPGYGTFLSA